MADPVEICKEKNGGEKGRQGATQKDIPLRYPSAIKYIIGNEFCERFNYYGMRTILSLYAESFLNLSKSKATVLVSAFTAASYTTPLLGAYLSDAIMGKFNTVLYLSTVYCFGSLILSYSASNIGQNALCWSIAGLSLIALGTGGIKPCVSAFGGDQIELSYPDSIERETLMQSFFSLFYFSINLGAALSSLITPLIRTYVSYFVAFLVPAVLMVISLVIFLVGKSHYQHREPSGSVFVSVVNIVKAGIFVERKDTDKEINEPDVEDLERKKDSEGVFEKRSHWLDAAKLKYDGEEVEDVKQLLRVLMIFLPSSIFWCLYDQQFTTWVFQAEMMRRDVFGFIIEPDQMLAINAVLILVFIPVFEKLIYPFCSWCGLKLSALTRMTTGMFLCALSFVMYVGLQVLIDDDIHQSAISMLANNSNLVDSGITATSSISILWQIPQITMITAGEIMFSITGLEVAYSYAPPSLSSIVTAFWLLTDCLGNVVTIVVVALIGDNSPALLEGGIFTFLCLLGAIWFHRMGEVLQKERKMRGNSLR